MMATVAGPVGTQGSLPQAPPKPWWTSILDDYYKKVQAANQKCLKHDTEKNRKIYQDAKKKYVQAVQGHQASYTNNFANMVLYCPSGQFWTLRQQQQTSFALPISPVIYPTPRNAIHTNSVSSTES